ncbi:hypothetical protein QLH32_08975 [Acinetobacter corruptisaponis]|uniref:Lipoprotein n=1 Tax=Acinetobacter corruptisaponis TaxID=3045147 RepID=A0ABY8S8W7_9GAMM|nr:hypothetical protein [Acinetobacter sp. KCTC 92772]WHP07563.1 hypothetical protein QLH32_08975 [Acinetobacter sp. KCTC 92772]
MKNTLLVSMAFIVTGCVSTSHVLPMGKDTFSISATADGFRDAASARNKAFNKATEQCTTMGKNFMFVNESIMPTRMGIDTTITLTFRCLTDNDPLYTRPNIQHSPDVIIENRNR